MPYLMVNLDDRADCRRAMDQLRELAGGPPSGPRGRDPLGRGLRGSRPGPGGCRPPPHPGEAPEPLGRKLKRVRERGVWKHLVRIANLGSEPRSLPELDLLMEFSNNKMRSLKAIMAKLEHRLGIQFLITDPEGSNDVAGNPRYVMPPRIRKLILKLSEPPV